MEKMIETIGLIDPREATLDFPHNAQFL